MVGLWRGSGETGAFGCLGSLSPRIMVRVLFKEEIVHTVIMIPFPACDSFQRLLATSVRKVASFSITSIHWTS